MNSLPVSDQQIQVNLPAVDPNNPPFGVNIQTSSELQPYLPFVVGTVLKAMQDNVGRNNVRLFLYNYALSGADSQVFTQLITSVADYLELLIYGYRLNFQQALNRAVDEVLKIYCALMVQQFPDLARNMTGQNRQDVQIALQQYDKLGQEITAFQQQFYGGGMGPGPGGPGGAPNPGGGPPMQGNNPYGGGPMNPGHGAPMHGGGHTPVGGHFPDPRAGGGMHPGHGGPPGPGTGGPPGGHHGGASMGPRYGAPAHGGGSANPGAAAAHPGRSNQNRSVFGNTSRHQGGGHGHGSAPAQERASPGSAMRPRGRGQHGRPEPEPEPAPQPEPQPQPTPQPTAKHHEELPPDGFVDINGVQTCAAHKSPWTRSFTPETPYAVAYDPKYHVLLHQRDPETGFVKETLKEAGADMEPYQKHELDPVFQAACKDDEKRLRGRKELEPVWQSSADYKDIDKAAEELATEKELAEALGTHRGIDQQPVALKEIINAHGLKEAEAHAEAAVVENGFSLDAPFEYYFNSLSTFLCKDAAAEAVEELANCDSLSQAAKILTERRDSFPNRLWYTLQRSLTNHVNEALERNIMIRNWEITSFVDDIDELREELEKDHGEVIRESFDQYGKQIVRSTCRYIKGESVFDALVDLGEISEEKRKELPLNTILLSELCSVTHLPLLAPELEVAMNETTGAVLESSLPQLYSVLHGIFERADEMAREAGSFRHHYLITADGVKLKAYRGAVGTNFYLLGTC